MNKLFILLLTLLFICGFIYPGELFLKGDYSLYKIYSLEGASGPFPPSNAPLLLFDGRKDTAVFVSTYKYPKSFWVVFGSPVEFSRIALYGGFQKSGTDFYYYARPKAVNIYSYDPKKKEKRGALITNIVMEDTMGGQAVDFEGVLTEPGLVFEAASYYPSTNCSCISRLAFSEVELYYGDEKYRVLNFDAASKEYKRTCRNDRLSEMKGFFSVLRKAEFFTNADAVLSLWGQLGVKKSDIYIYKQAGMNEMAMLELTFNGEGGYSGKVLAGRNGGRFVEIKNNGRATGRFHLAESVELGSWKIDEDGAIWVQAGRGPWKACTGTGYFEGTDIGAFESVTYP